ncbi:MAG TPA: hypothetical protein VM779_01860 [Thermoanaerobaculia bacterium]|nr:hypothetical protein [Thermoanaerobaculia bacterium]
MAFAMLGGPAVSVLLRFAPARAYPRRRSHPDCCAAVDDLLLGYEEKKDRS